jgi:protein-S-isoprenylcysteine O-methyltransferase Ste14
MNAQIRPLLRVIGTLARLIVFIGLMAALFFISAGRLDWPFAWTVFGIYALFMVVAVFTMDPELRKERFNPGPGGKDRPMRLVMIPLILAAWIVAGLDAGRFHWSDTVPLWLKAAAVVGFVLSLGLASWAVRVNRFFSPVVRIQHERGHHLITEGPYRYVRHPGYLGGMLACLCSSLALGSWWAMLPTAGMLLVFVRRIVIEDQFLREQLEGYSKYADQVSYRVLPGVW